MPLLHVELKAVTSLTPILDKLHPWVQAIASADILVKMEDGRVTYLGSPGSDLSIAIQKQADKFGPHQGSIRTDLFPSKAKKAEIPARSKCLSCSPETANMSPILEYYEDKSSRHVSQITSPNTRMSGSGIYLPMTSSNTAITPVPPTLQNFHILQPITTKPIKLTEDEDRIQGRVQGTVYR